jgi:adenosylcobinamide-GDP ribazoletransferase
MGQQGAHLVQTGRRLGHPLAPLSIAASFSSKSGYGRAMDARSGLFTQFVTATALLTRLPVGAVEADSGIARSCWAFPAVGAGIGGLVGLVLIAAMLLGLGGEPAATLAVLAGVALTGALHEDGLADTVDGFGGGADREQKLAIMRDSRVGAYGVLALVFSVGLRVFAVAAVGEAIGGVLALIAAHAASRALLPAAMRLLSPARPEGLGAAAGTPSRGATLIALALGIVIALAALGPERGATALALAAVAVAATGVLARRQIGGYTGDVLGAFQQIGEIVMLLAAAAK